MFVFILSCLFPGLATALIRQSALPSYYLVDFSSQVGLQPVYTTPFVSYSIVDTNLARILSKLGLQRLFWPPSPSELFPITSLTIVTTHLFGYWYRCTIFNSPDLALTNSVPLESRATLLVRVQRHKQFILGHFLNVELLVVSLLTLKYSLISCLRDTGCKSVLPIINYLKPILGEKVLGWDTDREYKTIL